MREKLQEIYESGTRRAEFEAEIGFRRAGNIRFAGKPSIQKLFLNVTHSGYLVSDHLIMTVGKEIPAVPMIYSRIIPGAHIKFVGEVFPYKRSVDNTHDYSIQIMKLLESKQSNIKILKEAWLNGTISSKDYLSSIKRDRYK